MSRIHQGGDKTDEIKRFLLTNIGMAYYDDEKKRYLIDFHGETMYLHRAVYIATYGSLSHRKEIHHMDHDKFHNHIENLMEVTPAEHKALHMKEGYRQDVSFKVIENTLEEAEKDIPVILTWEEDIKIDKYIDLSIELGY